MRSTNLYESLFILHKCNITIERLRTLLDEFHSNHKNNEDYALLYTYYITLESVNFLDEFNGSFLSKIEKEYIDRVHEVRRITSPIIRRINKWKDLEKFRNNIIAHPWRHKGKFVVPNPGQYNIPRNWFEIAVLVDLMAYLWSMIKAEFSKELEDALEYIATLQISSPPRSDYSNLNNDHLFMATEVQTICRQFHKPYFLKVIQYILPTDENS